MQMKLLDPAFPIHQQLGLATEGEVVLVNLFTMAADDEATFLAAWTADAGYMKARPGFVSTQLHRALGESPTYLNYATWESLDAFRAAFNDPGFRATFASYPSSIIAAPHIFQRIAVDGICAD